MLCPKCNSEINDASVVCTNCGNVIQNPLDNSNKNYVGMNRVVLSEQSPQPQNVFQQTQTIQPEATQIPTQEIQTQVMQQQTSAVQEDGEQTVQSNDIQTQQANTQQSITSKIVTNTGSKVLEFISAIIVVISAIFCLIFFWGFIKNIYYVIRLSSLLRFKYTILLLINYIFIPGAIIFAAHRIVHHPEKSYLEDLIIAAIGITMYNLIIYGGSGFIKFFGIKIILLLIIIEIIALYHSYFITKKAILFINEKLYIVGEIRQMLVTISASILMFLLANEITIRIIDAIFKTDIAINLLTK